MLSAQKHDSPRWGDYPEKTNLTYIGNLIRDGEWFDGDRPFIFASPAIDGEKFYAPDFMRQRPDRFGYLLNIQDYNSKSIHSDNMTTT